MKTCEYQSWKNIIRITNWYNGFTSAPPQYNATMYAKNSTSLYYTKE